MMSRWLAFVVIVAVVSLCKETNALVNPYHGRLHHLQQSPALLLGNIQVPQIESQRRHQKLPTTSSALHSLSTAAANGDISEIDDELPNDDDFQPRTMKVFESFAFFVRFSAQTILEKRAQRSQGRSNRRRLRHRLKQLIFRRNYKHLVTDADDVMESRDESDENLGIRESIRKLNESRKNLTRLVGYDSSLLLPAFSYLILGAFTSSIVPHFYSACISCVASQDPNRAKLMWAIGGLGLSHVAEALFTGFRGALFWIAGTFICIRMFLLYTLITHPDSTCCNNRYSSQLQCSSETSSQSLNARGSFF